MSDSLRDQLLGLGFKPAPKPERPARADGASSGQHRHAQAKQGQAKQGQAKQGQAKQGHAKPAHGKPWHGRQGEGKPAQGPRSQPGAKPADAGQRRQAQNSGRRGQGAGQGRPRTQEEIDLAKAYALRAEREKQERIEAERIKQEEARLRREAKAKLAELVKDKALNDKEADIARHFEYGGKIKRIYVNADQLKRLNAGELGVLQLDGRYLLVEAALLAEAETVFAPAVALKVDPNAAAGDDPYADPQYQVPDDLVW